MYIKLKFEYIRLKIKFLDQRILSLLEMPTSQPPLNCRPLIEVTQLELYLSVVEDDLLKINVNGKVYPNLSKEECSVLQDLKKEKIY